MKISVLKFIVLFTLLSLAFGGGYFSGHRNAKYQVIRSNSAALLPFFIGIHQKLAEGDIESAKNISIGCAAMQVLAIKNIEKYPLLHQFWSMFPYQGMPDTQAIIKRNLTQAYAYFSKIPKTNMPDIITYIQEQYIQEQSIKE